MGGRQSTARTVEKADTAKRQVSKPVDECQGPIEMTEEMDKVLTQNTYQAGDNSIYPYFLIQLSEKGELPTGENDDMYVSDSVAAYISKNKVTHIIAQTHGWNTPPEKAVAVPFTEFMGGMQNDKAMPTEDFHPVFVAFIWPTLPLGAATEGDALARAELIIEHEKNNTEDNDILDAAEAAKEALQKQDPDDKLLKESVGKLMEHSVDDDNDDDDENEAAIKSGRTEEVVNRARETICGPILEGFLSIFRPIMRPFETALFGRLMKRGRTIGVFMGEILAKFMKAAEGRPKVSMMANSLGAHMLVGALKAGDKMPYKIHSLLFIQGAISSANFESGKRFEPLLKHVAGPVACTFSERDFMLKNIFGPFYGNPLGFKGFSAGKMMYMKSLEELAKGPYDFNLDVCNSVNGSEYIDEGNAIAGGHGDFKEDETTSMYWNMIKLELPGSAYDL